MTMDVGSALRAKLLTETSVAEALGKRIYPVRFPQAPTYPAATYQVATTTTGYATDGPSGDCHVRIQFDVYAATYKAVLAVASTIRAALNGWSGTAGDPAVTIIGVFWHNEMDLPVPDLERAGPSLYRRTLEAIVWYEET
jgi:hypothetical protein